MPGFVLTRAALDDLRQIGRFTAQQWGIDQRNRYLRQLDAAFHALGENPDLGNACDDIRSGYRKLPQGSHMIFYTQQAGVEIRIVRILHKRMDVPSGLSSWLIQESPARYMLRSQRVT